MRTHSLTASRYLVLRQIDVRSLVLVLALLWTATLGLNANADSIEGREIPTWSNDSILLPELAFGGPASFPFRSEGSIMPRALRQV